MVVAFPNPVTPASSSCSTDQAFGSVSFGYDANELSPFLWLPLGHCPSLDHHLHRQWHPLLPHRCRKLLGESDRWRFSPIWDHLGFWWRRQFLALMCRQLLTSGWAALRLNHTCEAMNSIQDLNWIWDLGAATMVGWFFFYPLSLLHFNFFIQSILYFSFFHSKIIIISTSPTKFFIPLF